MIELWHQFNTENIRGVALEQNCTEQALKKCQTSNIRTLLRGDKELNTDPVELGSQITQ